MGRPKDEYYWNQVDREEDGGLKCKHCGLKFKGGVSRIKAHIDLIEGKGIRICPTSPKCITSSDHSHQDINAITLSQGVESNLEMDGGASTSLAASFEGNEEQCDTGVLTTLQSKLDELRSDLTREEKDIQGQLQLLESHGKRCKRKVDLWLNEIQNMKQRAIDMKNSLNQFRCSDFYVPQGEMYSAEESQKKIQHLTEEIQKHKKLKPLVLSNEYFGRKFEKNVETLWKLMRDDRVFIIGIYGMGGVGKTFLAKYMQSEIKRTKTFENVLWFTVPYSFSIFSLQEDIAKIIKVRFHTYDETERAMILTKELEKRGNIILILDDVWRYVDLEMVGISLRINGIKLIITSRLRDIFQQMDCLSINIIEVSPFYYYHHYNSCDIYYRNDYDDDSDEDDDKYDEALKLFLLKLGSYGTPLTLSPEVRDIVRYVVKECDGLPLGISVMAQTMKGKTDIHWWRRVQNKFDKLKMGVEMQDKVFTVLRRSYFNLKEKDWQKCFLYIALLPNFMRRNCLIKKLVDTGQLEGNGSLEEIFDEANVLVDKLVNDSLLEANKEKEIKHLSSYKNDLVLSMHGLVRKMALNILKQSVNNMMIKCNGNMTKIPYTEKWATDLEVVSLAHNNIQVIPEGTSPNCPRLSTLLLFENSIYHIPECFFAHMEALKTLDLSKNKSLTCLPHSLSNLTSLTSLMLHECSELNYIPPLGELHSLLRLQISSCSIKAPPQGLENLINLKWLDLSMNKNLKLVPGSFLPSLTKIHYLDLLGCAGGIEVEDVKGMTMLECFAGTFVVQDNYKDNFSRYVREILDSTNGPQTYFINLDNKRNMSTLIEYPFSRFKDRTMSFSDCKELIHFLPRDLLKLELKYNDHWICLCYGLSSYDNSLLEEIRIYDWKKLKSLFCSSCYLCTDIKNLQSLNLNCLESLTVICKKLPENDMFSSLKTLCVHKCHQMKILLTSKLVRQLQNLESITVSHCNSIEQIFGVAYDKDKDEEDENEDYEDDEGDSNIIILRKLTWLSITYLPQLKTVYKGILICTSGFKSSIENCPQLCKPRIEYEAS
ncbi:probable disease resistance protein At4g27220 isoform X2 [Vigna radiata var. radiata]|uniref:Probable disease resistance protein At4g27220 isoform X2 n=1 Tax=Vigna radiata var. radiata TaxID=3916 RepID=A0A3Q0EVM6_VIGRR|nr:probable disease resistance protein At4g27220 isoform X2 [Vigna radiata var. radiata]